MLWLVGVQYVRITDISEWEAILYTVLFSASLTSQRQPLSTASCQYFRNAFKASQDGSNMLSNPDHPCLFVFFSLLGVKSLKRNKKE